MRHLRRSDRSGQPPQRCGGRFDRDPADYTVAESVALRTSTGGFRPCATHQRRLLAAPSQPSPGGTQHADQEAGARRPRRKLERLLHTIPPNRMIRKTPGYDRAALSKLPGSAIPIAYCRRLGRPAPGPSNQASRPRDVVAGFRRGLANPAAGRFTLSQTVGGGAIMIVVKTLWASVQGDPVFMRRVNG